MYGTPAYRAGLLAGDRILEIDGKSTDGLTLDEAVEKLKGEEGNRGDADRGARRQGGQGEGHAEAREDPRRNRARRPPQGRRHVGISCSIAKQHIGYVRLTAFSRDTAAELQRVLTQLQEREAARADPRLAVQSRAGCSSAAIEVSDLFVSEGRIVSTKGRNSPERAWDAHKEGTFEGFPMVVLVNRYTRQRQRDRGRLPARPQAGGHHRRADLGQRKRAERDRTGETATAP